MIKALTRWKFVFLSQATVPVGVVAHSVTSCGVQGPPTLLACLPWRGADSSVSSKMATTVSEFQTSGKRRRGRGGHTSSFKGTIQRSLILHWPELGPMRSLFQSALCPATNWEPVELGSPALASLTFRAT